MSDITPKHLIINKKVILLDDIICGNFGDLSTYELSVMNFCKDWLNGVESFQLQTSGSTGEPKTIIVSRAQMQSSAKMTLDHLQLQPGTTALCCLSADYIAGKMMIVRALVGHLQLTINDPSNTPLENISSSYQFTAMVPTQVEHSLMQHPDQFNAFETILIGGAAISTELELALQSVSPTIYHTYGMTETLSHVAMRRLNHENQPYFTGLKGVEFGKIDGCLTIKGEVTQGEILYTNDIVELIDDHIFFWLGRKDNVINSGGLKIHPEQLEREYTTILATAGISNEFYLTSKKDPHLGEKLVMVTLNCSEEELSQINLKLREQLDSKITPKEILSVAAFETTPTGKIKRIIPD